MTNQFIDRLRSFESRFGEWVIAARWPVILISLVLVAVAASGVMFLKFTTNYRIFFDEDNPQFLEFKALENTYGKSDNVLFMIVPEDRDAFSQQALEAVIWVTDRAWQIPNSTRVDSLANFQHTTAEGDDLSVRDLVDPTKLGDEAERARMRAIALAEPGIIGQLLARDGSVSAVNVIVHIPDDEEMARIPQIADYARELVAEAEDRFPGIDLRLVGTVMINHTFTEATNASHKTFLPASLAIMALVLGVMIRGIWGVLATGSVIIFSVMAAIGMGSWVGLPLSPPTAPVPSIVLMVAIANCTHVVATILQRLQAGDSKHAAIVESLRVNLHPVFLASLTTTLGFLSMNFSEVPPYRHLGTFVAFGVMVSFVLSVTFLPALLSVLPLRAPAVRRQKDMMMSIIAEFVIRRQTVLLWGSSLVVLALLAAIPRNELNDVLIHFFDESVEFRQDASFS